MHVACTKWCPQTQARIPLSCSQATSSQQRAALPGANHQPETTMVLETLEEEFCIFYTSCFNHSLQPTCSVPHKMTPISSNFLLLPKNIYISLLGVCPFFLQMPFALPDPPCPGISHDTKHSRVCHFNSSFVISWSLLNQSFMEGHFRRKCRGSRRRKVRNHPRLILITLAGSDSLQQIKISKSLIFSDRGNQLKFS